MASSIKRERQDLTLFNRISRTNQFLRATNEDDPTPTTEIGSYKGVYADQLNVQLDQKLWHIQATSYHWIKRLIR